MSTLSPVRASSRLSSLDTIRGFAVLGILIMNIQSFSMPEAAYLNPTVWGDFTGMNRWVWTLSHLLADSKFMALFAMLFGAGFLIFIERAAQKTDRPGVLHGRRMVWLLLFGLLHAYFIWSGDILFIYAVCGLCLYFFRHLSIRNLWLTGLAFLLISSLLTALSQWSLPYLPASDLEALHIDWQPTPAQLEVEIKAFTGSWPALFRARAEQAMFMQTYGLLYLMLWQGLGYMLIGMAVTKQGLFNTDTRFVISGRSPLLLLLFGYSIISTGVYFNSQNNWAFQYSQFGGMLYNDLGSIFVAFGYLHGGLWLIQQNKMRWLTGKLANVGRMALTNYMAQSLVCTGLFYGTGFGLFGQVERSEQLAIVFLIWGLQLMVSQWWLQHFLYGPLEWIWRQLTYSARVPLKR